jgi:hypothetical protein
MGCDIHLYVECVKTIEETSKWVSADRWDMYPPYSCNDFNDFKMDINCRHIYSDRNYDLFTTLGNVRNEDQKLEYISEPKGIPFDACKLIRQQFEKYDCFLGTHSYSWLTLHELKTFHVNHQGLALKDLISILEEKKKECDWMNDSPDTKMRIVFWFDS